MREEGEGLAKQLAAAVAAGVVDAPTADLYTDLNNLDAAYTAAMNAARGKKKLLDEAITAFGEVRDGGEALAPEAPVVPVVPVDADAAVVVQLYSDPVRRLADKVVAENRRDAPAADGNDMAKSLKDAGQLLSTLGDSVGGDTTKNADTQSETINVLVSRIRNNLVFLVEREADGNLADPGDGEWQEIVDGFALLRLASRALRNYDYFKQGGNIIPGSDETFRSGDHQDKRCSLVDSVRDDTQFCGQNKVILCEKLSKVTSVAELKNALTIDDDDDDA
ncbi:MAG: hypothetical protein LBT63_00830 [Holosporaceae bacterium]|nr:hypothetical protein [Holosporaceae bacterium]